jgi:LysR family transcriptional regulator, glycine cleavage system transcriptional activator
MHSPMPGLNALRAFEAAARHLSLTKAALELHVTASALSHQIRGLEELLGMQLFVRGVRSIALTSAGKQLYPGLQTGFTHIRDAVAGLRPAGDEHILVISTPPGLTAKWLAPRLYRFSNAHPEIDARVSSSLAATNFITDGVDVALRSLRDDAAADADLAIDKLIELTLIPVCSPRLIERQGPFATAAALTRVPLIHDDSLVKRAEDPRWGDWFAAAGVVGVDVSHGLRFNSADHAIDATVEGAGVLLTYDFLAYDALRGGRLAVAFPLTLRSGRAYYFVCPRKQQDRPKVRAFREWVKQEVGTLEWDKMLERKRVVKPDLIPGAQTRKGFRSQLTNQ